MKLTFLLLAISVLVLFPGLLRAQFVSEGEAIGIARNFATENMSDPAIKSENFQKVVLPGISKSLPQLYCFSTGEKGFVIVSAEKSTVPVLAYSDHGKISAENYSPAFMEWIENLRSQIDFYRANNITATTEINEKWDMLSDISTSKAFINKSKAVAPLIHSSWEQAGFYNDLCPESTDGEAVVGCVAVAMAQVMYYWRYPQTGNGSSSYFASGFGTQSVNYGASTYNWNYMANTVSAYNIEVAKLLYHCGVSVEMSYGVESSGAYTWDVPTALEGYFKYNAAANYQSKNSSSTTSWKNKIVADIDAKRPLIYSGSGEQGGHAFNLDGYQGTDYYHFNFGWGGYGDGYFYIDAINPVGNDFTNSQAAVFSIYPANPVNGCTGSVTLTETVGTIEDGSGPAALSANNSDCQWLISPVENCDYIKIMFQELNLNDGDSVIIYKGNSTSAARQGAYSGSTLPAVMNVAAPEVLVRFVTNSTVQSEGFLLRYDAHSTIYCNSSIVTLTDPQGTITDGSNAENYSNNTFCRWTINPAGAASIHIDFTAFDIQSDYDIFKVIDLVANTVVLETSGSVIPTSLDIASDKVSVWFKSDGSYTGQGFSLNYLAAFNSGVQSNEQKSILVFPNPVKDILGVNLYEDGPTTLQIYDLKGAMVYQSELCKGENVLNISYLTNGLYNLKINSLSLNYQTKILKQ